MPLVAACISLHDLLLLCRTPSTLEYGTWHNKCFRANTLHPRNPDLQDNPKTLTVPRAKGTSK